MSKIIISKAYNLQGLSNNYDNYDNYLIYLAYIKDTGYVLICESNSSMMYAVKSNIDPKRFYKNPHDDKEAYEILLNEVQKHLNKYYDEIGEYYNQYSNNNSNHISQMIIDNNDDIVTNEDIIDYLMSSLDDRYNAKYITKIRDYQDETIRQLIRLPNQTFDEIYGYQEEAYKYYLSTQVKIDARLNKVNQKVKDAIKEIKQTRNYKTKDKNGFFIDILDTDDVKNLIDELTLSLIDDTKFNKYHQDNRGIFTKHIIKDKDTGEEETKIHHICRLNILDAWRILDPLDINPTTYIVSIYNIKEDRQVLFEYLTYDELFEAFKDSRTFYKDKDISDILNYYLIDGCDNVRYEAYKPGFYMIDNKIVENTQIKKVKFNNETLANAIKLFNSVLEDRSRQGAINDCEVYRFSLWSPFSFVLKQLGITDGLYALILIGMSQTNKTGATFIASHFYQNNNDENTGSTPSTLASRLEESTFMSVFDECSHLFSQDESINVIKRAIYEVNTRGVKNRNNNRAIDDFKALGLPVFILNETIPGGFKDFIVNRYHRVIYKKDCVITNKDKLEFNKKFMPRSPQSPLNALNIIGRAFANKLIAIINDVNEHHRLYDIESLTIELLQEISEDAGEPFDERLYNKIKSDDTFDYDMIKDVITQLNKEFKDKNRMVGTIDTTTLVNSVKHGDFDFITYHHKKGYIIDMKEFKNHVNGLIKDGMIDNETLITGLGLSDKTQEYRDSINNYSFKNITYRDNKGEKQQIRGFVLNGLDVLNYIFNINNTLDDTTTIKINTPQEEDYDKDNS